MTWRRGDLGRFLSESAKRPRFEVIGPSADKRSIVVWYGGMTKTDSVLIETFKRDCTNLWELQEVVPKLQPWVKEGADFEFPASARVHIRQYEIMDQKHNILSHVSTADLSGKSLRIRRIRRDYTSCDFKDMLVLVPLPAIAKFGIQRVTRWDMIMSDDDPYEEPNDDDLFKDI